MSNWNKKNNQKTSMRSLGLLTLSMAIVTIVWVITFVIGEASSPPVETIQDKIAAVESQGLLFHITYFNAAVLTLLGVIMFAGFYVYCRSRDELWSAIAFSMVPIYGIGNIVAYLSQVLIVPELIDVYHDPSYSKIGETLLRFTLHTWPGSAVEALNSGSYAVLGIPSVIFPVIAFRHERGLRIGGSLLAISGLFSIIAFVGVVFSLRYLLFLSPVGGVVFLVSLFPISRHFLGQGKRRRD
ncbi:MAG: hypothetical protein GY847_06900 [Proteobacteria bacterium]|nr:hypothetical protein [Pseudomonadota bacterium]